MPPHAGRARVVEMAYAFFRSAEASVPAAPEAVFEILDDPRRLGRHMESPSAMMMGGSMRYVLDAKGRRQVGSLIRVEGSVLGLRLSILERVVLRDPPRRKAWETIEEPRLLVFGQYRLGFEIERAGAGSRVHVSIGYDLPRTPLGRLLGPLGAHMDGRWCVDRMLAEAAKAVRVGT